MIIFYKCRQVNQSVVNASRKSLVYLSMMDHMHPISGPTSRKSHYPIMYVTVRNKKQRNSTPKV